MGIFLKKIIIHVLVNGIDNKLPKINNLRLIACTYYIMLTNYTRFEYDNTNDYELQAWSRS